MLQDTLLVNGTSKTIAITVRKMPGTRGAQWMDHVWHALPLSNPGAHRP